MDELAIVKNRKYRVEDGKGVLDSGGVDLLAIQHEATGGFLCPFWDYGQVLWDYLPALRGLVLITGATGSGKTQILNALLWHVLGKLLTDSTPPQIVAVGDPVETWLYPARDAGKFRERTGLDLANFLIGLPDVPVPFLPRTVGVDVESVSAAVKDALRETPKCFVISELRDEGDMECALEFASTGHLVMATAHATSLVDAMGRLMRAQKATSTHSRALLASRISLLVHLSPETLKASKGKKTVPQMTFPRIWRNTSLGIRSFMADGLAALQIPGTGQMDELGLISYRGAVLALMKVRPNIAKNPVWSDALERADRRDLQPI